MVVCKFFLQGNCRFGESCKFEHQLNSNRVSNTSILRQQNFNPNANVNTTGTGVDTNTLLQSVVNDMTSAEKGGQWMLSCYSPFKEKALFPGFEDQSFEEVRWAFYQAQQNGTLAQYCQQLHGLLQNTAMQIKLLQNPTPEIINTITAIYYSATPSAQTAPPTNTSSIFGQPSNQNSSATSIFATANQKFFGVQPPVQTNPIFGNTQNIFANPNNNNTNSSPFTAQQLYKQQPLQQQQQGFGNSSNIFKVDNTQVNNTIEQMNSPLFQNSENSSNSIFGSNENTVISFQQKPNVQDETAYSKLEDLCEKDIKQYESDSFEFGQIPEKPPTFQMCF